jgi:DNA-binding winged helix-turn-helix (wHTH) protein/TolB-like protein/Tfp pilus assembly protein PilF
MASVTQQAKHFYEFGPYRLDTAERVLLRDGQPVPLTPKALQTLLVLVESSGRILDKDVLLSRVWPDTFVEEITLAQNVSTLRKMLGVDQQGRQYIETVPRRGYRFVANVSEWRDEGSNLVVAEHSRASVVIEQQVGTLEAAQFAQANSLPALVQSESRVTMSRRLVAVVACVAVIGLAIAGYFLLSSKPRHEPAGLGIRSIAVLPFKPLLAESRDEALELGMADALITKLSNLKQIIVRPTSAMLRYTAPAQDPLAAGREQGVDSLIEGRLQRSGDKIRVTVQLIRVSDGVPLWAGTFDESFTSIFAVQDSISKQATDALRLHISGEEKLRLAKNYTDNIEAYQLYMKGRYFWNKRSADGNKKAIEYYEQAIELDPNYALAYAGLADSYSHLPQLNGVPAGEVYPKEKAAVRRALELDDTLAEAHTSLATLITDDSGNRDWAGTEREFKRAIELSPNYTLAHIWYSQHLEAMGRLDESAVEASRALELDPLSPITNLNLGHQLYFARNYNAAIRQLRNTLEMDPNQRLTHIFLRDTYVQKGMYQEAISETARVHAGTNGEQETKIAADLRKAYASSGERGFWQKFLDLPMPAFDAPFWLGEAYLHLNEKDKAFEWLRKAADERHPAMDWIKVDPVFDSVRSDPRFADLLRRLDLPN